MRRRDFIAVLGSAAGAWPLAASAQKPERMRRIGVLMSLAESNTVGRAYVAAPGPPPPPPSVIPLNFNDPLFATGMVNVNRVILPRGQNVSDRSINTPNSPDISIIMNGNNIVTRCRVNSRECVRVRGSGLFRIDGCWLEAKGLASESDHADVIQAYAPGNTGTIHITNTTIRAYNTAATAGMFVADNWTGTVRCENVVFWGGPFGARLHSDVGGDLHIYFKDVFFVGPFGYGPHYIRGWGGTRTIIERWDNVQNATVVNGVLVPGSFLSPP